MSNQAIYKEVTARIVAMLEAGVRPWAQGWQAQGGGIGVGLALAMAASAAIIQANQGLKRERVERCATFQRRRSWCASM